LANPKRKADPRFSLSIHHTPLGKGENRSSTFFVAVKRQQNADSKNFLVNRNKFNMTLCKRLEGERATVTL
jgi:hypothetical protein